MEREIGDANRKDASAKKEKKRKDHVRADSEAVSSSPSNFPS